ncbi:MAG: Response regulator of zinc sigma-54-dependent two-component system [Myxococcaceae bacterium]|nr:Response regulator of zinc sigma-54-dependent two-component system [Myxococcaceae bacterium]
MPTLFGRYEYAGELGRGASGRVFAVLDHAAGQAQSHGPPRRAIKVVPQEQAGRLVWEFARLCQVEHPRVARVRELLRLDEAAPAPFALPPGALLLVEDFVEGAQLSVAIAHAPDARARAALAVRAAYGIAEGLAALHDVGLVHGDLKPDNVLCDAQGEAVTLIDLGFARPAALASIPRGTPAYMAPELFAGVCTPAGDVFALGAVLYDCLRGDARVSSEQSGNVPWRSFDLPLPELAAEPALARLLARLLEPDHARRPADAHAALALLAPAFAERGLELAPTLRSLGLTAQRSATERAARARTLPFIGHGPTLRALVEQLGRAELVLVCGVRGSGRSRLIREAIRLLQAQRARTGGAVPTWVSSLSALERLRGVDVILWLDSVALEQLPAIERAAAVAKLAVRSVCVVVECAGAEGETARPLIEPGALDAADFSLLLDRLLAPERASSSVLAAARSSSLGLAGRLCELASSLELSERDLSDERTWSAGALEARAAPLSPAAREVACALAWWGEAFSPAHAARLVRGAEGESGASERAYDELRVKGLLAPEAEPAGPALSLVPALALQLRADVSAVRGAFSRRIAASGVRAVTGFAHVAEGSLERAKHAFFCEAQALRAQGRSDAACALLAEARRWISDPKLSLLQADSERAAGRYALALELLVNELDPDALLLRAELSRMTDQQESASLLLATLVQLPEPVRGRAHGQLARLCFDAGELERARSETEKALKSHDREAQLRALEVEVLRCLVTGELSGAPGDALVASATVSNNASAPKLARELDGASFLLRAPARAYALRAQVLLRRGERGRALLDLRTAVERARALGEAHETATYALNLALVELENGELGRALETLREAAQRLARVARTRDLARVLFNFAALALLVGDFERCQTVLAAALRELGSAPDHVLRAFVSLVSAELSFSRGALDGAERELQGALASLPEEARSARAVVAARACQVAVARHALERAGGYLALAKQNADATDVNGALELLTAELSLGLAQAELASAERLALQGMSLLTERGSFAERLRFLLVAIESARASGNLLALSERRALARAWLERALVTLPSELRATMRSVPAYARVFASADYERDELGEARTATSLEAPERWRALVRASRRLFGESREPRIAQRLSEIALELVHAERALVIAFDERAQLSVIARTELGNETERPLGFSRSVVERVALDRQPLMTVEAGIDVRLDRAESVAALQVRSVLCIELFGLSERAFLYLDDRLRPAAFAADDVALLEDLVELSRQALRTGDELLREARRARRAEQQQKRLSRELSRGGDARPRELVSVPLVGASAALTRVVDSARKVAGSDAPLLITGESGTGKELLARFVHEVSLRKTRAFVAESCAALPDSLLESALFGHVRGAFTGADRAHKGLFETADGGTLFLDEVGEMSASLQGKLLRVLQEGELRPVGSERTRTVDVRVIGATRRDLRAMVQRGGFREDLYYRLAVVTLELPSLRARPEDIAPLVAHFLAKHAQGRSVRIAPRALRALEQRAWPGNVRELENEIRRALAFSEAEIDLTHLSHAQDDEGDEGELPELDLHGRTDSLTRKLVREALARSDGNVTHAALLLGISRFGLQKILKRLQVSAK